MTRVRLKAWNPGSRSAALLARKLNVLRLKRQSSFIPANGDIIINWGCSDLGFPMSDVYIINSPYAVKIAADKLKFFDHMTRLGLQDLIVKWTTKKYVAENWFSDSRLVKVVGRKFLNGHSGAGIQIFTSAQELLDTPSLPLYTKYFKRVAEYRVHVVFDTHGNHHVLVRQKLRRLAEVEDHYIRTHKNGWIFGIPLAPTPEAVLRNSVDIVEKLGLDFGAVDIGYNEIFDEARIFEVNTAPGLEGSTIDFYAQRLQNTINQITSPEPRPIYSLEDDAIEYGDIGDYDNPFE